MGSLLSVRLPSAISDLVTQAAFDRYTMSGPDAGLESRLLTTSIADLFETMPSNDAMAKCCLSGLWLLHNFLDHSHEISQNIHSAEGSYWHGIMHRLEGDFGNSKYWYRKVGTHPVFELMPGDGTWDPFDFVDRCESTAGRGGKAAQEVQATAVEEWKHLFDYCYQHATR